MRVTVALDAALATAIRRVARQRKVSFRQAMNAAMCAGVSALAIQRRSLPPRYQVKPVSLGKPRLPDLDCIPEVLAIGEAPTHA